MTSRNLWGDLEKLPPIKTPAAVLREQAKYLEEGTRYVLNGAIRQNSRLNRFIVYLDIVAPALNDYSYSVLQVDHPLGAYPLQVDDLVNNRSFDCQDEKEFLSVLGQILSSPAVQKAISSLVSQSGA